MKHRLMKIPCLCLVISLGLTGCEQDQAHTDQTPNTVAEESVVPVARIENNPPNILLIMVDDLGLTDIGAFGSEIDTPNLDQLANNGVKLTNFHASPQCAPTRSILMSGTDNHIAGMGSMFDDRFIEGAFGERFGYEGYLHQRVASLPERLGEAGYSTYMAGKWHLGMDEDKIPTARGFDKSYALMDGSANHFNSRGRGRRAPVFRENGKIIETLPDDFYSTNTYTDKIIEYISSGREQGKPFFAFMALTTPHWPMQVPEEYKDIYAGRYDEGYDVLRAERIQRAEALGILPEVDPALFDLVGNSWDELTPDEQKYSARSMEIYAAMIKNMDDNIGRVTAYLEQTGELENTFIFFMSDNGAESDSLANPFFGDEISNNPYYDNSYENIGNANSWVYNGPGWAQAAMAPYRMYKGFLARGGTLVSAFAHHPSMTQRGHRSHQYLSVKDLMPTLLDIAEAEFDPTLYRDRTVVPIEGRSFVSVLEGHAELIYTEEDVIAQELHGQRSLQRGDWKILWEQKPVNIAWYGEERSDWNTWKLFNLKTDPTEAIDLSEQEPELFAELVALWDNYAAEYKIRLDIVPRAVPLPPAGR